MHRIYFALKILIKNNARCDQLVMINSRTCKRVLSMSRINQPQEKITFDAERKVKKQRKLWRRATTRFEIEGGS